MSDGPRVVLLADRFRIVELANGDKTLERLDGTDAMGGERWRELKFGEADATSRLLRDWIFGHLGTCPLLKAGAHEDQ